MKAIYINQFGSPEQSFVTKEIQEPIPEMDEVLIKVNSFGLNYADVMARKGLYNDAPPIPFVPGYEVVGEIVKIGNQVNGLEIGNRVLAFTLFGAYAEYAKANQQAVIKLPESISNANATALATQYCTAWYAAIMRANIQKGERVLIHAAAGGVGTALVQLAKWRGCKIIGTAGSDEKLDYISNNGADEVINYRNINFEQEVKRLIGNVDAVFDPIGGKAFRKNFRLLDKGGRLMMYGVSDFSNKKGTLLDKMGLALNFGILHPIEMLMHSKGIIGINMLHVAQSHPHIIEECLKQVVDLADKGILSPHVSAEFGIGKLNEAHHFLGSRSTVGKLVINWNK